MHNTLRSKDKIAMNKFFWTKFFYNAYIWIPCSCWRDFPKTKPPNLGVKILNPVVNGRNEISFYGCSSPTKKVEVKFMEKLCWCNNEKVCFFLVVIVVLLLKLHLSTFFAAFNPQLAHKNPAVLPPSNGPRYSREGREAEANPTKVKVNSKAPQGRSRRMGGGFPSERSRKTRRISVTFSHTFFCWIRKLDESKHYWDVLLVLSKWSITPSLLSWWKWT